MPRGSKRGETAGRRLPDGAEGPKTEHRPRRGAVPVAGNHDDHRRRTERRLTTKPSSSTVTSQLPCADTVAVKAAPVISVPATIHPGPGGGSRLPPRCGMGAMGPSVLVAADRNGTARPYPAQRPGGASGRVLTCLAGSGLPVPRHRRCHQLTVKTTTTSSRRTSTPVPLPTRKDSQPSTPANTRSMSTESAMCRHGQRCRRIHQPPRKMPATPRVACSQFARCWPDVAILNHTASMAHLDRNREQFGYTL